MDWLTWLVTMAILMILLDRTVHRFSKWVVKRLAKEPHKNSASIAE